MKRYYILTVTGVLKGTRSLVGEARVVGVKSWPESVRDIFNYLSSRYDNVYSMQAKFSFPLTFYRMTGMKRAYRKKADSVLDTFKRK